MGEAGAHPSNVNRQPAAMPVALSVNVLRTNVFNVYPLRALRLCGEKETMGSLHPSYTC